MAMLGNLGEFFYKKTRSGLVEASIAEGGVGVEDFGLTGLWLGLARILGESGIIGLTPVKEDICPSRFMLRMKPKS